NRSGFIHKVGVARSSLPLDFKALSAACCRKGNCLPALATTPRLCRYHDRQAKEAYALRSEEWTTMGMESDILQLLHYGPVFTAYAIRLGSGRPWDTRRGSWSGPTFCHWIDGRRTDVLQRCRCEGIHGN